MKRLNFFKAIIFLICLSMTVGLQAATYPTGAARVFMQGETNNSYVPESTVRETFRPRFGKTFPIKYLEIPAGDLHVIDTEGGSTQIRQHLFVSKDGKRFVRFFIHPDSEGLYKPLIKKYGVAGTYTAAATASTRSVLAWPDSDPKALVFLKLSLAQVQDGLGRIIPGWEVRRSVGISEIAGQTADLLWKQSGASIIPEFAGAYVDARENLPFYVDGKQGDVVEHGLIARDASFLSEFPNDITVPLFSLFNHGPKGEDPLIIKIWNSRRTKNKITFVNFVGEYLFKPFLEKNKYLLFHQGIIPEFHGQNVVVVLDKKTKEIKHFFHRDVGSMKVDLRLRWTHGLSVDALRTPNAQFDFKFVRAPGSIEDNLVDYLNDWLFRWTYLDNIRKFVPDFDALSTQDLLVKMARETLHETLPLRSGKAYENLADHLEAYYAENPPKSLGVVNPSYFDSRKIDQFIASREATGQVVPLPREWKRRFEGLPVVTEYGIVYEVADGNISLALHASSDLDEIQKSVKKYKRIRSRPKKHYKAPNASQCSMIFPPTTPH